MNNVLEMTKMKAVIWNPGSSEQLPMTIEEMEIPTPKDDEVLIRLYAAALNNRDVPRTKRVARPELPKMTPGSDGAGEIVSLGKKITNWNVGDKVILDPYLHQEDNIINGAFAQFIIINESNILPMPRHLSFEEGASLAMGLGTAWRTIMTKAQLKEGETILIQGIGGGVALFALQIAVTLGAKVIVTSGSDEKILKAKELGAFEGINYRTENVIERVKELTDGKGADVVVDTAGKATIHNSLMAVCDGGKVINYGAHTGHVVDIDLFNLFLRQITLQGTCMYSKEEFKAALSFYETKQLKPVISAVFEMENVIDMYQQVYDISQFGKLVLNLR